MIAPNKYSKESHVKPKAIRGHIVLIACAIAAVCLVAIVCSLLLREGDSGQPKNDAKSEKLSPKVKPQARIHSATREQASTATADKSKEEKPKFVKRPGAMQLPDGRVLTFKPPKEGEFRIVHSHGLTFKCDHLGNWEDVTPKPVFDNSFEESLVGLATTGNFIPGMLMGLDRDEAVKMLTKPVVVNDDDSEDVAAKKKAVAEAKEVILDYMKDGASLDDFVMAMRKQVVKERFIKGIALKEIVTLLKEGRIEEAGDVHKAANEMLKKETGGTMQLPAHIEEALEDNK